MKRFRQLAILLVFAMPWKSMATEYTVQPGDNLSTAISKLQAGDILYLADGQYNLTSQLSIKRSGNASAMITIAAAEGAKPIIDFRGEANKKNGIVVSGNYLQILLSAMLAIKAFGLRVQSIVYSKGWMFTDVATQVSSCVVAVTTRWLTVIPTTILTIRTMAAMLMDLPTSRAMHVRVMYISDVVPGVTATTDGTLINE